MKIDEQSRRTERYSGDVPVVLADGQQWCLPKPRVRYAPKPMPDGNPGSVRRTSFGRGYDEALDEFLRSETDETEGGVMRQVNAHLSLASALIRINYDLTDDEVEDLVQLDFSADATPEDAALRAAFLEVAHGIAPKGRSPDMSGSA